MPKSAVWLSYDLGVRGDYEGLYVWLDGHKAKECGDSLAFLQYRYKSTLLDELKADLKKNFSIDKKTRIYAIYHNEERNSPSGRFLFGGRRPATWEGSAASDTTAVDEA